MIHQNLIISERRNFLHYHINIFREWQTQQYMVFIFFFLLLFLAIFLIKSQPSVSFYPAAQKESLSRNPSLSLSHSTPPPGWPYNEGSFIMRILKSIWSSKSPGEGEGCLGITPESLGKGPRNPLLIVVSWWSICVCLWICFFFLRKVAWQSENWALQSPEFWSLLLVTF